MALLVGASCHVMRIDELLSTVASTLTTAASVISRYHNIDNHQCDADDDGGDELPTVLSTLTSENM